MTDARTVGRRVLGVAVPVALCATSVWVWGQAPSAATVQARDRPSAATATAGAPSTPAPGSDGAATGATPSAGATPSGGATPSAGAGAASGTPGSAGQQDGVGVDTAGVRLSATPTATGTLEVSERVVTSSPVLRIVLRPPQVRRAGPDFTKATPVLTAVQLTVDGQPVVLASDRVDGRVAVDLAAQASSYELRYVLEGATVRSVPSTAGRALAALAPVSTTAVTGADTQVVMATSGTAVRNLTCPRLTGDARACADGATGAMATRAPLAVGDALVVLQLDLPRP